jgi:aspartyl/asparaginyl beta-hydroxylase (cupin superfamily)
MLMPHEGPWCGIIRIHLALIVPKDGNGCTLVVNGIPYIWEEGKCVVFDDTYEHIAVNETNSNRVVLFLDYMRPLPLWLSWFNWLIIKSAKLLPYFKTPIKRHKEWEKRFYGEN